MKKINLFSGMLFLFFAMNSYAQQTHPQKKAATHPNKTVTASPKYTVKEITKMKSSKSTYGSSNQTKSSIPYSNAPQGGPAKLKKDDLVTPATGTPK